MKPIRFTRHALRKLLWMQRAGFILEEDIVVRSIQSPEILFEGYAGRVIAQMPLDDDHVLRVVYEENGIITVVTLYPGRRERYEG